MVRLTDPIRHLRRIGLVGTGALRAMPQSNSRYAVASWAVLTPAQGIHRLFIPAHPKLRDRIGGEFGARTRGVRGAPRRPGAGTPAHPADRRWPSSAGRQPGPCEDQHEPRDRSRTRPLAQQERAQRQRHERVDVRDDGRPARAGLADQHGVDDEGDSGADEAEHHDRGPRARPGNWLPTGGVEKYVLVLRLYDTPIGVATRTGREAPMPALSKRACQ